MLAFLSRGIACDKVRLVSEIFAPRIARNYCFWGEKVCPFRKFQEWRKFQALKRLIKEEVPVGNDGGAEERKK